MPKKKLTDTFIRNYLAPNKRTEIYDKIVSGLAIRITKTGSKSFVYRYRHKDKVKRFTIGTYPKLGLAQARKEVKRLAYEVSQGIDPLAEKRKKRNKPSPINFSKLAKEFKQKHIPTLREITRDEYKRIIDVELKPALGNVAIKDISKHDILKLLDNKAYKDKSPTMANRIRARLSKMYTFAISRGLADYNPVSQIPTYKEGETKRKRFYDKKEIQKIWKANENQRDPGRSVIKMLFLTGQRLGETRKMKRSCINGSVWTIPSEDAKNKVANEVPLSDLALRVIDELEPLTGKSDYVFNSPVKKNTPVLDAKRTVTNIREQSKVEDFRAHDIRRTVTTHMAKLKVDRTVLGKLLNHGGNAGDTLVTAIYDRHDYYKEKQKAIDLWTDHLRQILDKIE